MLVSPRKVTCLQGPRRGLRRMGCLSSYTLPRVQAVFSSAAYPRPGAIRGLQITECRVTGPSPTITAHEPPTQKSNPTLGVYLSQCSRDARSAMPRGPVWPAVLQCSPRHFSASMDPETVSPNFLASIFHYKIQLCVALAT